MNIALKSPADSTAPWPWLLHCCLQPSYGFIRCRVAGM